MFGWYQNCFYLCTRFSEVKYSGCSAVRLAHLLWEQGVVGSNPATPTSKKKPFRIIWEAFFAFCRRLPDFADFGSVYTFFARLCKPMCKPRFTR